MKKKQEEMKKAQEEIQKAEMEDKRRDEANRIRWAREAEEEKEKLKALRIEQARIMKEEQLRLDRMREEERLKYLEIRKQEEKEKAKATECTSEYEKTVQNEKTERIKLAQLTREKRKEARKAVEKERDQFPIVLFVAPGMSKGDNMESLEAAEKHLVSQGRNVLFCEDKEETLDILMDHPVPHVIIVGLFGDQHDQLLDLVSEIVVKYQNGERSKGKVGPNKGTKVFCSDAEVRKDPKLQQRCKSFGIECVRRGVSLWKLLGVKPASLKAKSAAESVLSFD